MNIFLTGAGGFIGRHCAAALEADGHGVIRGVRRAPAGASGYCEVDFESDVDPATWKPRLAGVDLVINSVGTMGGADEADLEAVHVSVPIALFDACAELGIRVIQLSALGADDSAVSQFHRTKKRADDHLLSRLPQAVVLQPSLVYGPGGASARLFEKLASLPLIPLPRGGTQRVQPVHVEDLVRVIVLLAIVPVERGRLPVAGPAPMALREFLDALRKAMGFGPGRYVAVPVGLAETGMRVAAHFGAAWASEEALGMLERGNTADTRRMRALLGRDARPVGAFIAPEERARVRTGAQLGWLRIALRLSLAAMWLGAALVSAGLYPLEGSVALVERTGIRGTAALALVYLGVAVDAAFGLGTLFLRRRRLLWAAQLAVIAAYTAIITLWLPGEWLHPFGPVLKNLPVFAAILLLYVLEDRRGDR